jgi:hypothetical protein
MNATYQRFTSDVNRSILIKILDELVQRKYQITLFDDFEPILKQIMNYKFTEFGNKPATLSEDDHIKNLNKITMVEADKYIEQNIGHFPKLKNTQINNPVHVINTNQVPSSDPSITTLVPYSAQHDSTQYMGSQSQSQSQYTQQFLPQSQSQQSQSQSQQLQSQQLQSQQLQSQQLQSQQLQSQQNQFTQQGQNLFKNNDDLYKQMQYNPSQSLGPGQQGHQSQQSPYQYPNDMNEAKLTDKSLNDIMEMRKRDFPGMAYKPPGGQGGQDGMSQGGNQGGGGGGGGAGGSLVMTAILNTQIAMQNPNLIPAMINEIMQMSHLVDMMNKNPQAFQQTIQAPGFLQMIVNQIKTKSDPKNKPMDFNETPANGAGLPPAPEIPSDDPNSEFQRRLNAYKTGGSEFTSGPGGGGLNFENSLNKYIPPSEQLVNNTLPDLDVAHLIDYSLCLDFRNDLETTAKNRYLLKFHKYGNISKVKLNSCMIPENDYLAKEPYIYVKIEELGGRCYTSNHDCVFGKLVLCENRNGYLYYKPDEGSCMQVFSQPKVLDKFTLSILNYQGKYLNLREIIINKSLKLKKQNKLKFITEYKHKLTVDEEIEIHIYRKAEIDSYRVQVDSVLDDQTFTVNNEFEVLTDKIKVLKASVNCSLNFQLSEINWNLLTNKTAQNAQLITLSQLVTAKKPLSLEMAMNKDLAETIKTQLALPTLPPHPGQQQLVQLQQPQTILMPYGTQLGLHQR